MPRVKEKGKKLKYMPRVKGKLKKLKYMPMSCCGKITVVGS